MTYLLYQEDSYIRSFEAQVVDIDDDNHGIILDQTAFYPGGGGQPPDVGTITFNDSNIPIKRAKNISGLIVHLLERFDPLPPVNTEIMAKIAWERRYKLMRTHTAMHILCGVIFRDYGASVTGGNIEQLRGRMDFEFETMRKELVEEINLAINQEVEKALPVNWRILPREEAFKIPDLIRTKINLLPKHIKQVRIVEINGLDLQADGGTHVRNTKEVGRIQVTNYKSKGKINKRIYIELEEEVPLSYP
jgi:misacylated tRNA(Ala) deacylase